MSLAATNTNGVSFLLNNLQGVVQGTVNSNTNAVAGIPQVVGLSPQTAAFMAGRQPGGPAYRQPPNVTFPNNTNAAILLDAFESSVGRLGYTKSGAFLVQCSTTNAVSIPLTNTQTNTNSYFGDTTFATVSFMLFRNLSGVGDGSAVNASMSINGSGTNGFKMGLTTNSQITLDGAGSIHFSQSVNGLTVNAANAVITVTPTNGGIFACVIGGA